MPIKLLLWGTLATFIFVIGSFLILIWKFSSLTNWAFLVRLDYKYLAGTLLLFFLYHTFDMLRLKTIAEGYRIYYSYPYGYAMSFIATFGATVTPAHIGGELILFYMLKRLKAKNYKIWGTLLFKTVSGISFFLVALPIFVIYTASNTHLLKKLLILAFIFIISFIISFPLIKWFKKYQHHQMLKSLKLYCYAIITFWKKKKFLFIKACLYSILLYITFLSFAPLLLKAFHINFNWIEIYLIQLPLIYAIFSSPTPGGSGVGELGGAAIFQDILPASLIGLFIILWRFFSQYLGATIGGGLFIFYLLEDIRKGGKNY